MKAVVDIGTNTLRMLIGTVHEGKVSVHAQFIEEPRLGVGITKGELTPEAVDRTVQALEKFQRITRDYRVKDVAVVATSAVRDAANKQEFTELVFEKTGWQVEILSGKEEAAYSFSGAVATIPFGRGIPVVIDIGGGSTEIIYAAEGEVKGSSVNVGAVRLAESRLSPQQLKEKLFPGLEGIRDLGGNPCPIGVGGTATTAAAIHYGIEKYSRPAVQGKIVTLPDLRRQKSRLEKMTLEERKRVPGLSPQRADIIVPGLEILVTVLEMLGSESITVSDAGILDGLLLRKN
ncbi:Ppx/GppA phosphatase family protein [Candidatus Formimonas warabiya]|uniref:Ppx/GppA phosphatase N-terminal domain-containing protein n=1 Tax=Formimonas warabiya TaxID=1761012 RepID=A0A3G1KXA6_FORW1|nr:Ppx/GppA phosphatase family protein [Candidatus Formimonas warabiya]ATW26999.1 hypothetical protein DCMF_21525 [Candidatus Formimonas warabiya]